MPDATKPALGLNAPLRPGLPIFIHWPTWFEALDAYAAEIRRSTADKQEAFKDSGAARLHLHAVGLKLNPAARARGGRNTATVQPTWGCDAPDGLGRVYSKHPNIQGIPKPLRRAVYYPGRLLVTLDLEAAHLRALALAYANAPNNPHKRGRLLDDINAGDPYSLILDAVPGAAPRALVKRAVSAFLNAMSPKTPPTANDFPHGYPVAAVHRFMRDRWGPEITALERAAAATADQGGRGRFCVLEHLEASIMVPAIRALEAQGWTLYIPMHDGAVLVAPDGAAPEDLERAIEAVLDPLLRSGARPAWTASIGSAWGVDDRTPGPADSPTLDDWATTVGPAPDMPAIDLLDLVAARAKIPDDVLDWVRRHPQTLRALAALRPALFRAASSRRQVWTAFFAPALRDADRDVALVARDRGDQADDEGRDQAEGSAYDLAMTRFLEWVVEDGRIRPWYNSRAHLLAFDKRQPTGDYEPMHPDEARRALSAAWRDSGYKAEARGAQFDMARFIQEAIEHTGESGIIPVRDPLDEWRAGLPEWDGVDRLSEWLPRFLLADPERDAAHYPIISRLGFAWLLSAAVRILKPGARVEGILILRSAFTGTNKSALFTDAGLLPSLDWLAYTTGSTLPRDQSGVRDLVGPLVANGGGVLLFDEMSKASEAVRARVRAFATALFDQWRWLYHNEAAHFPRTWVCAGTSNDDDILPADQGNRRRYWVVDIDILDRWRRELSNPTGLMLDLAYVRDNRDQLWAQALAVAEACIAAKQRGEDMPATWWLSFEERQQLFRLQESVLHVSPATDAVCAAAALAYIARTELLGHSGHKAAVSAYSVAKLLHRKDSEVEHILAEAGWRTSPRRSGGRKAFLPPTDRGPEAFLGGGAVIDLLQTTIRVRTTINHKGEQTTSVERPRILTWARRIILEGRAGDPKRRFGWSADEFKEIHALLTAGFGYALVFQHDTGPPADATHLLPPQPVEGEA